MRFGTSSLITMVCLMAGMTLVACSDDSETPGSGGAGGNTTSSTTSGPGSTTSSSSSAAGGGGNGAADGIGGEGNGGDGNGGDGTGGSRSGSVCERACARAEEECGVNFCEENSIDCSTPQFDCIAQCVLDARSCEALSSNDRTFGACLLLCAQDTGAGGGGNSTTCGVCSLQSGCLTALNCDGNTSCEEWARCAGGCFIRNAGPECFRACDEKASEGGETVEALYREVYACTCTSCEAECEASADPCSVGTN